MRGERERGLLKKARRKLYNRGSFSGRTAEKMMTKGFARRRALTEAVSSRKVSSTFSKVAGCGAEPRRAAFLFVNFFFAPAQSKKKWLRL